MKWINVEDELPEKGQEVLTITADKWYRVLTFGLVGSKFPSQVTYWIPLPEPPSKSVKLRINKTDYPLTNKGENALKKRLLAKYPPETIVSEWVDGELVNTTTLDGIFN